MEVLSYGLCSLPIMRYDLFMRFVQKQSDGDAVFLPRSTSG